VDLAVWWQQRRWRALLELIEQLPPTSRFQEAVYNDPEQARLIAMQREYATEDGDAEPWSPRLSEYDLHAMLLREIAHNVAAMATQGKTGAYLPAPRTEVDRQADQLARLVAQRIGARFGFSPDDF
jgi:hypothetical protein